MGEDELRLIADSAPVIVWVSRLDGTRSFVNRAYREFLGLPQEQALAFDWRTVLHPEDETRVRRESIDGEARLETFELEARFRNGRGEWRWLHSTSAPRRDAAGRHIGFIGVAYDITETKAAERASHDREARLSALISQSTAGFAQVDLEGRFTMVNDRFCEIAGWPRAALMQTTMQAITHPDDLQRNVPLFERAIREGTPYTHEKRYLRADGGIVWVNNSVSIVRGPDGAASGVLAVTLDISERRAHEAELRRSEERLRLAIESAGMASWELDLETMQGEWSPNRFDLLGLPRPDTLRGTFAEWLDRVHPGDRERTRAAAFRCFDEGVPFSMEYRICRADDGRERWLHSHGNRVDYPAEDHRSRFVGVSFDITDRKRAEEELRVSEARFRTIFEQANDYLITTTLDNRLAQVNPAVLTALGYSESEVLGRPIGDFMDADQLAIAMQAFDHKLREGGTTRVTVTVRTREGRQLTWEINSRLTVDERGRPNGLHAIGRDVTEARRSETHLRLLIDELNHRVKNTLAIVQGIAQQTFKPDSDPADARRAFEGRLAALSEAHALLTREHWGAVSMTRIIRDAVAPHGGDARFTLDGPELALLPKTAISLALAIHELATNAVKHGALSCPEGQVTIRWERDAAAARLSLRWSESGGPPVTTPVRRGFGTRMIERGLAAELGGTVTIAFQPQGLICTVDAPLPEGAEA